MKRTIQLLLLSITSLIISNCDNKEEIVLDSPENQLPIQLKCGIDDYIKEEYDLDAHVLAVKLMNSEEVGASDEILIPENYVDNVLRGLSSVYAFNSEKTDGFFNIMFIHTAEKEWYLKNATVNLPANLANEWKNNGETSNEELNAIISEYNLTATDSYSNDNNYIKITSDKYLNMKALCKKLTEIDVVNTAYTSSLWGDGNNIDISLSTNSLDIIFKTGSEDCPSGCLFSSYHKYNVMPTCEVQELESEIILP